MSERGYLLDSSVLIALATGNHVHHEACFTWLEGTPHPFHTCLITEGALLRTFLRTVSGATFADGLRLLRYIAEHPRWQFLADTVSHSAVPASGILRPQQITDAFLAHLARVTGLRLVTLDRAQAALHSDVSDLIER